MTGTAIDMMHTETHTLCLLSYRKLSGDQTSTCRKKLNDHTPFDSFSSVLGNSILEKYFNITRIKPESVQLKPSQKTIWAAQRKENSAPDHSYNS